MTFDPGPRVDVAADSVDGQWRLVFTREFRRHSCERVWGALTQPDQLARWSPWLASRPLDQLGDVTLTMLDGDAREDMAATVVAVDPPNTLEYRMGTDTFVWRLTPAGTGCRLVLEHVTDERDMRPMVAAGWHLCLAVADANLAGEAQAPIRGADARNYGWEDLAKEYGETLDIPYTGWPFDE